MHKMHCCPTKSTISTKLMMDYPKTLKTPESSMCTSDVSINFYSNNTNLELHMQLGSLNDHIIIKIEPLVLVAWALIFCDCSPTILSEGTTNMLEEKSQLIQQLLFSLRAPTMPKKSWLTTPISCSYKCILIKSR